MCWTAANAGTEGQRVVTAEIVGDACIETAAAKVLMIEVRAQVGRQLSGQEHSVDSAAVAVESGMPKLRIEGIAVGQLAMRTER